MSSSILARQTWRRWGNVLCYSVTPRNNCTLCVPKRNSYTLCAPTENSYTVCCVPQRNRIHIVCVSKKQLHCVFLKETAAHCVLKKAGFLKTVRLRLEWWLKLYSNQLDEISFGICLIPGRNKLLGWHRGSPIEEAQKVPTPRACWPYNLHYPTWQYIPVCLVRTFLHTILNTIQFTLSCPNYLLPLGP